ncbi:MAG: UvrD-helicase domain-containing protein [Candidatus Cloacimonetes bacterium]|nr:UvrD-helicase domain-containing protein [Candidatus Cloacimonadota bacterium]
MTLTAEQQAVVRQLDGPLIVLAPVGSGKTRVLAERLLAAVSAGHEPRRCLCLTFTNRAARELRERIASLDSASPGDVSRGAPLLTTFHSFCAGFLRQEAEHAGLRSDFSIYDEDDCSELLVRLNGENGAMDERDAQRHATALFFRWSAALSALGKQDLRAEAIPASALAGFSPPDRKLLAAYLAALGEHNALDFSLLVYRTRALLACVPEVRARWESEYDWVQVDEVQDTHESEWEVLEVLAAAHGNIALFGDLDQTIYGWRGSHPDKLMQRFRASWPEARELKLSLNHRSTKQLLRLAEQCARRMNDRHTSLSPSEALEEGEAVELALGLSPREEAAEIARRLLRRFSQEPESRSRTAVLVRSHWLTPPLQQALNEAGIACATEADLRFFRRREVRDLLAPLHLLVNGRDRARLARWLRASGRMTPSLGKALLALMAEGPDAHLRVTDLLDPDCLKRGDPFARLLSTWHEGMLAVVDLETTGLDPADSEIVEIAAEMVVGGFGVDTFQRLLKVEHGLRGSDSVHGISEAELGRQGVAATEALHELASKLSGLLLVGHNFGFDLGFLLHHWKRHGLEMSPPPWVDTLDLARRVFPPRGGFSLGALRERLNLSNSPTHRAADDVACTVELLARMIPELERTREEREDLVRAHAAHFAPLAARLDRWQRLSRTLRPAELLDDVLQDFVAQGHPVDERIAARVRAWLRQGDRPELDPDASLKELLSQGSLVKAVDLLGEDRVPILTIHASKGMEFDHVVLAGAAEGILPDFRNSQDEGLEEERRVFYVAITRPRRSLLITSSQLDKRGRTQTWSRFVSESLEVPTMPTLLN